jgi:hypothetical protein
MLARLRLTLATTAALLAAVAVPAHAQTRPLPGDVGALPGGGAFVIQSCGETGSSAGWQLTSSNPTAFAGGTQCPPQNGNDPSFPDNTIRTGAWVADRFIPDDGTEADIGDHAEMTFTTTAGTTITRARYWRFVAKRADDNWRTYVDVDTTAPYLDTCDLNGAPTCNVGGAGWYPNDVNESSNNYRDADGLSTTTFVAGLRCLSNPNNLCSNGSSLNRANAEVYSAFFTITDPSAPTVGTPSGEGWTTTEWSQGPLPLSLSSSDNTGISATRVYADGSLLATLQGSCSYDRPRPCTDEAGGSVGIPTAGLADGAHAIEVAAVDAAGNETRLPRPAPLNVDNQPPAAPVGLTSPASTSTSNSFTASWALPADAGTPIVAARYRLCQNGTCGAIQTAPSLTSVSGLSLPASGTATLRAWLVDQLGHENAAAPATLTLAYTPVVQPPPTCPTPGAVPPQCAAPTPTPTPVPTPDPPPPACCDIEPTPPTVTKTAAGLRLTTTRRTGRKVTVTGKLSSKASGRVTVRYRIRLHGHTHTVTKTATITHGSFRANLVISKTLAAVRTGTVSVAYKGDNDTKSQSRTATLRVSRR